MKYFKLLCVILLFMNICYAGDDSKYGKELTLKDETKISAILNNPVEFLGKRVLIKGKILDVCPRMGCWIDVAADTLFEKIQVKVKDGKIVFPVSAKGKIATVEGEVEKLELTREQLI